MSFYIYSFQPLAGLTHPSTFPSIWLLLHLHQWTHSSHWYVCSIHGCTLYVLSNSVSWWFYLCFSHSCKEAKTGNKYFAMWTVQTTAPSTQSSRTSVVGSMRQLPQIVSHHLRKLRNGPWWWWVLVFLVSWCLIFIWWCFSVKSSSESK